MAKKLNVGKTKKRLKWNLLPNDSYINDSVFSKSYIEVLGNKKIEVSGCEGVYEYTADYIKLRLKQGALVVTGKGFDVISFDNKVISVKGEINSIEFCV